MKALLSSLTAGPLLILVLGSVLYAQISPGFERVPASQVSGTTLIAEDHSFKIDAPPGWDWYRAPIADRAAKDLHPQLGSETFLVADPATRGNYMFTVVRDGSGLAPSSEYMRGVGDGLERTSPKTGWRISNFKFEPSRLPIEGAYSYSCLATSDTGTTKYRFGYIVGDEVKYHFVCSTSEATEPRQFRSFVASFRLLARR